MITRVSRASQEAAAPVRSGFWMRVKRAGTGAHAGAPPCTRREQAAEPLARRWPEHRPSAGTVPDPPERVLLAVIAAMITAIRTITPFTVDCQNERDVLQRHRVFDQGDDQDAGHRAADRAAAADQDRAADHDGRDRIPVEAGAGERFARARSGRDGNPGERGEEAARARRSRP